MSPIVPLTAIQQKALALISSGSTIAAAARETGVHQHRRKLASSEKFPGRPIWREALSVSIRVHLWFHLGVVDRRESACIGGSFVPPRPEPIFISLGGRNADHGVSFVQIRYHPWRRTHP